jgi:tetratricopeptide (TPR) repeat protein
MTSQNPGSLRPSSVSPLSASGASPSAADASGIVPRLREEIAATSDKPTQSTLQFEVGSLEEARGDEPAAARDYLAAFNADPQFREPLEALVRILGRRRSVKNLGKLLDALARAADSPEERSRALWEQAVHLVDHEQNPTEGRARLEDAVAENPEDPMPWLELELLCASSGDVEGMTRAIEARSELTSDPTWKGLLGVQLAELAAKAGNVTRAYELLDAAAALDGRARFLTRLAMEKIAAAENDLDVLARALEGQAEMILESLEDEARGDEVGVPRFVRKPQFATDAWVRAADAHRRKGDPDAASSLLRVAAQQLPQATFVSRARLAVLEQLGDSEASATLAKEELARGATGSTAASLWLRVAEWSAQGGDREGALGALRHALDADPRCVPARALELDLLGDGRDPGALASSIEACAETYATDGAKGRAYLVAALTWASLAEDATAARTALSQAGAVGTSPEVVARFGRTLASLLDEPQWFEESSKRVLATTQDPVEQASLWFELGRSRLLRGDRDGAREAFGKLSALGNAEGGDARTTWLGRVLSGYAIALAKTDATDEAAPARSPMALEALADVEADAELARGLRVVAAARAAWSGDVDTARERLTALHESAAGDVLVATFLAELHERAGALGEAADVIATCAHAIDDAELAASLQLEAAILWWRSGDRAKALSAIEASKPGAGLGFAAMITWARRGADADSPEGRLQAIEAALEGGADAALSGLERFALDAIGGDADDARVALERVESTASAGGPARPGNDVALSAALARIIWQPGLADRTAAGRALDLVEASGDRGAAVASGERVRIARDEDGDLSAAVLAASAWFEAEPTAAVAFEWLGAAAGAEDRNAEIEARRRLGQLLPAEAAGALEASSSILAMLDRPTVDHPLIDDDSTATILANLEVAPPGCDPRRRAYALHGLGNTPAGDVLGPDARVMAEALAGWSDLASGDAEAALRTFQPIVEARPEDVAAWEGVRASAESLGDAMNVALASAQLGALCKDDARGAELWEHAGLVLIEHPDGAADAAIAFERAFERDPSRDIAFDRHFRRVRAGSEDEKFLQILTKRLDVAEDETEIAKLFWEQARVLRKKGDVDGALSALENVTMLEPEHVGALALSGEIHISRRNFEQAAPLLATLAKSHEAPTQQRLVSGVAAADLYEKRLEQPEEALAVLLGLHREGLSTLPVRERLAALAARTGAFEEATSIFEQVMNERDTATGRVEAARIAMVIHRDELRRPEGAAAAITKLLSEVPDDPEALDLLLSGGFEPPFVRQFLDRGRAAAVAALAKNPTDADRVKLVADIALAQNDQALRQATLGALVALGRGDAGVAAELAKLDTTVRSSPTITLDATSLAEIADPGDNGPITDLFLAVAETVTLALGPTSDALGANRKNRVEARGGHPLRVAVAEWMGALGVTQTFELYQGGNQPRLVQGVFGEEHAFVCGPEIQVPLDAAARSAIAREVFALRRGITAVRTRDDAAIASVAIAACNEVGVNLPNPGYAVFTEVQRGVHKEISRKVKKQAGEAAQRFAASGQDARAWAAAARRSLDRMAVIAAGDVSIVLSEFLNVPRDRLAEAVSESERAKSLLGFVLSPRYLEVRRKLGMVAR